MINEVRTPYINNLFAIHTDSPLSISTPPATSDECTHPDVIDMYMESGGTWNGHRYWMALTPLPTIDPDENENPCIYYSDDLITWIDPGTNPITPSPGGGSYNADVDLYFNRSNNSLYCFYRSANTNIVYKKTTDGAAWGVETSIYILSGIYDMVSPSFIRDRGSVRMYGVTVYNYGSGSDTSKIFYRSRTDIESGDWGDAVECVVDMSNTLCVDLAPAYYYIWHINIKKFLGVYYLFAYVRTDDAESEGLYICASNDGINFMAAKYPLFVHYENTAAKWDTSFYRSTLLPFIDSGEIKFNILYSGWLSYKDNYPDYIGKTQILNTSADHITIGDSNSINGRRDEIYEIANSKTSGYVFADDFDRADDLTGLGTSSCGDTYDVDTGLNIVNKYAIATSINKYFLLDPGITDIEISYDAILNGGRLDIIPKYIDGSQFIRFYCVDKYWHLRYYDYHNDPPNGEIISDSIRIYDRFKTDEINNFKLQLTNIYFKFYINGCMVIDYLWKDADFSNASNRLQIMSATKILFDFKSTDIKIKGFWIKDIS